MGGQLASAFEAECEPAARESPSEKRSIGLAGVPGTDPRLLWWQRGVDRPTMGWWHRGRRQESTITETIRSTIAGNLGAPRREFPAPQVGAGKQHTKTGTVPAARPGPDTLWYTLLVHFGRLKTSINRVAEHLQVVK